MSWLKKYRINWLLSRATTLDSEIDFMRSVSTQLTATGLSSLRDRLGQRAAVAEKLRQLGHKESA